VQGTLAQVEQRQQGWMRFHIMEPGNQYATKVDTKKPELVQQCMSLLGQQIVAEIREQESTNINPNSGRPYVNRYLNAIAPAGYSPGVQPVPGAPTPQQWQQQQGQQMPVQPGGQQQWQPPQQQAPQQIVQQQPAQQPQAQPPIMGYDKDINIMRQTAAKVVAMSWEILPLEQQTPVGMVEACEAWMAYFIHGPLRFGVQPFSQAAQQDGHPLARDPEEVYAATGVCPDCGHSDGQHAPGCPREQFVQA
jgi:hypothetical protein